MTGMSYLLVMWVMLLRQVPSILSTDGEDADPDECIKNPKTAPVPAADEVMYCTV